MLSSLNEDKAPEDSNTNLNFALTTSIATMTMDFIVTVQAR